MVKIFYSFGTDGISKIIDDVQGPGSDPTHVGMIIDNQCFEMTFPKCQVFLLTTDFLATHPTHELDVTDSQKYKMLILWQQHLGKKYPWWRLFAIGNYTWWKRWLPGWLPASWIKPLPQWTGQVCSEVTAEVLASVGLWKNVGGTTPKDLYKMYPADE